MIDLKKKNLTSIHQLEMSRELRAASTFSTHSFSDSTLPAVQSSFARHSCLSWEQGSAPHDLEAQLAESEEEEEEQEERQTEEQGAVEQVERQEERAFRQQDAQKNLGTKKKISPSCQCTCHPHLCLGLPIGHHFCLSPPPGAAPF